MNPAPLSKVLKVVSAITNNPNREETVATISGTLEMLYNDPNVLWNYFKAEGCVQISHFTEPCRNGCLGTRFAGAVMPAGVKNIREIMVDGHLYDITEERVDAVCHLERHRGCQPMAEHLPPRLLERDIPSCGDSQVVTFRSDCADDCGKLVGLRYIDRNFNEQREDIELGPGRVATTVSVVEFLEITFPERSGFIHAETADGAFLGKYHPSILVPRHEWFRFAGGCNGMKMSYRGLKEFAPVVFDTDMVPFSDSYRWRLALKAYENADSMELTNAQVNGLSRIFAQLAQVGQADLASTNNNFNPIVIATASRAMLGVSRRLQPRTSRVY